MTSHQTDEIATTHHGNGPDPKRNRGEHATMDAVHQGQAGMQQSNGEMRHRTPIETKTKIRQEQRRKQKQTNNEIK